MAEITSLQTNATMPFADWWNAVVAEADRREASWLLGDARSHREAWQRGNTPVEEVQAQIDVIPFFL